MRDNERSFKEKNAALAVVGLGDRNYANTFREEMRIGFPLFVDEERGAYRELGLKSANLLHMLRKDNAVARNRARAAGYRQHKLGRDPFQLGGSFIFAPGNVDKFGHISETFSDNAPMKDLLAALM